MTIQLQDLPYTTLENKNCLPSVSGCYLVVAEETAVLYVGCSTNLYKRWKNHNRVKEFSNYDNVRICWLVISEESLLLEIEKALIEYFNPRLNNKAIPGIKRLTLDISEPLSHCN